MSRIRFSTLLPIGLFLAMGIVLAMGLQRDPKLLPSTLINRPVPAFDLVALDGSENLRSKTFVGDKFVILNVFASWCVSCRVEHPYLMELGQDKRFKLVGLNWKDTDPDAKSYLEKFGNPFAQVGTDPSGRAGIDLGVSGVPETFLIDGQGRVRVRIPGPLSPEIWKTQIEPLLAGKSS
jgi:cytochrome c biogenesis protein CcmG, thiol:disulfide interchange protein DsbE